MTSWLGESGGAATGGADARLTANSGSYWSSSHPPVLPNLFYRGFGYALIASTPLYVLLGVGAWWLL